AGWPGDGGPWHHRLRRRGCRRAGLAGYCGWHIADSSRWFPAPPEQDWGRRGLLVTVLALAEHGERRPRPGPGRSADNRSAAHPGSRASARAWHNGYLRSEERRVGKECGSRRWTDPSRKKKKEVRQVS